MCKILENSLGLGAKGTAAGKDLQSSRGPLASAERCLGGFG